MRATPLKSSCLLLSLLLAGCRTMAPAPETKSAIQSNGTVADGGSCPKPVEVKYAAAPADQAGRGIPKDTTVGVSLFDFVNVEVRPDDFRKLDSHECKADGTCTATMTKPVKVNVNVPVTLMSKIAVTYEQAKGAEEGMCVRNLRVGTKISPPFCLGKILDFSINIGLGVTKTENSVNKKVTYDAKPYCNAHFNCNVPFLAANAQLNNEGLTFGSSVSANAAIPKGLVKVSAPPTRSYHVPLPNMPESLKRLREYFSSHAASNGSGAGTALAGATPSTPDIWWDDIAMACMP